jgi:hypothetical protein
MEEPPDLSLNIKPRGRIKAKCRNLLIKPIQRDSRWLRKLTRRRQTTSITNMDTKTR